jgi:hypothetical protein
MYTFSSIRTAINQPRVAVGEFNRLFEHGFNIRASAAHNSGGMDILSADWDYLIILDACRFDAFKQVASDLPGTLTKVESKASATTQFLRANFSGQKLHDTVYVTANPQLYRLERGVSDEDPINAKFHTAVEVWQDNWHSDHRTVMPEVVTEAALRAVDRYPNKRLIVHYMQPHAPYVGETGVQQLPTEYLNFWSSFREGEFDISLDIAKQAYRENLELVLPEVSQLLSTYDGKTVVTADHGESLGERDFPIPIRRFGHPSYTNLSSLLEVPWLVHENGSRPDIISEVPDGARDGESINSDIVKQHLRDLGYSQ